MMQAVCLPCANVVLGRSSTSVDSGRITVRATGYTPHEVRRRKLSGDAGHGSEPVGLRVGKVQPGVILTPIWGKRERPLPEVSDTRQGLVRTSTLAFGADGRQGRCDVVAEAIYRAATEMGLLVAGGGSADVMAVGAGSRQADEWVRSTRDPSSSARRPVHPLCSADILNAIPERAAQSRVRA